MKLKVVNVSFSFVLAVEDETSNILKTAREFAGEAYRDLSLRELDILYHDYSDELLPSNWNNECYPYNGGYSKTIKDYLKEENDNISASTNI